MKKKDIKKALSRFDDIKIPDKYKVLAACGEEYEYKYRDKRYKGAWQGRLLPALLVFIMASVIAVFATASATIEDMQEFMQYVEYRVRYFYADGSYRDEIKGSYVDKSSASTSQHTFPLVSGIVIGEEYLKTHTVDTSDFTACVEEISQSGVTLSVIGEKRFMIYKNYVKLERMNESGEWEILMEGSVFEYTSRGDTLLPRTDVIEKTGEYTFTDSVLMDILSQNTEGKYRITVKISTDAREYDFGDVSAEFTSDTVHIDEVQ